MTVEGWPSRWPDGPGHRALRNVVHLGREKLRRDGAAARDGSLEVLRRGADVCLSTSVVELPNGQVLVLVAESDWDLVRRCRPAASAPAP